MRKKYNEINGDLIQLAKNGEFDVISHGCNCFCNMSTGIAPQMVKAFGVDKFTKEKNNYKGDFNKLGTIDYGVKLIENKNKLFIVNSYTQYKYGANHKDGVNKPLDYDALRLCMRKINYEFQGKRIGLPQIGCGLAGGDWNVVKNIIQEELKDCYVTIVIFNKK